MNREAAPKRELVIFFVIVAVTGLGMGLSDSVISNYFKDAYNVTAAQRGFIEFPRELPGFLCFLAVAALSFLGDIRLAMLAQALCAAGITVLGLWTPSFSVMILFLFINSMGMHLYIPLQDSIGVSIIGQKELGRRMGQYNALRTGFLMLAGILIFVGFKAGFFSFKTQIKLPFLIAAACFFIVMLLYLLLYTKYRVRGDVRHGRFKLVFKREYRYYYILSTLHGTQKQIMFVFGPWVLIELLGKGADTLALLAIVSSFLGIFVLPAVGRWIDRVGAKKLLLIEGTLFVVVYIGYGLLSGGFSTGLLPLMGIPVAITFGLFVFDRLAAQLAMVRIAYLKSVLTEPADLTPTLSTGMCLDHAVSITCAWLGGILWNAAGPQYVFFIAAAFSLCNIAVALRLRGEKDTAAA